MKNTTFFANTVGRRKTAGANLDLTPGSGQIKINGQTSENFFVGQPNRLLIVQAPVYVYANLSFDALFKTKGGGLLGQAQAIQLALARALVIIQPRNRDIFRKYLFLTRDSRKKERRKYGLKKSRKAPQFSKR